MRRYLENKRASFGEKEAIRLRETFQDKPWEWEEIFSWGWPKTVRAIGVGRAVMYRSDKWKKKGKYESYKHVCESKTPWELYAAPGFAIEGQKVYGEEVALGRERMPGTIATLALFLGLQAHLFERDARGLFLPEGDEGLYQLSLKNAKLAAGRTKSGELFLLIYVNEAPELFLFGEELDVEKDGIVG